MGTLKMREWKHRHGSAGAENAGVETPGSERIWKAGIDKV